MTADMTLVVYFSWLNPNRILGSVKAALTLKFGLVINIVWLSAPHRLHMLPT